MSTFKIFHQKSYPAIDPSSPGNSQAGKTILITGGSTGIGLAIASAFLRASAARIIITGRRANVLEAGVKELEALKTASSTTSILSRVSDIGDQAGSKALWNGLKDEGIEVDVLILNAASLGNGGVSSGLEKVWHGYETNVLGNLTMVDAFLAHNPGKKGKVLINISTSNVHLFPTPAQSIYSTTKTAFTHLLQHYSAEIPVEECQILSVHPGRILSDSAKEAGYTEHTLPWDSADLPGSWCVWASTPKAAFLHGRFVWSHWDVDELQGLADKFEHPGFLRLGLQGIEPVGVMEYFSMT
ncbi:hypothetical protein B0O99DRAFT_330660 [Bisporella sp. PMI_857]|nr:hypothetical protein B0O99DRAFT_330660 [Bisporella sp. PMI_857]